MSENRRENEINTDTTQLSLTEQEEKIIEILRSLDYGEMRIVVKDGAAVHIEEIKKSIKL
ncbi:MAG: DUF2292 domain-containing protein [Oscillospiraceae bacterium]|nr:DUF2292 domain-containing protein [Oscillospiraceae bacterium]